MAGYRQAIKLLDDEIRALRDRLARFSDQPGVSREAQALHKELQRKEEERLLIQQWLDNVDPESLQWGPDQQLDEMMGRYPSQQMELPLTGGQIEDVPFTQPPAGFTVDDPYKYRDQGGDLMEDFIKGAHDPDYATNYRAKMMERYRDHQDALRAGQDPAAGQQSFDEWMQDQWD